MSQFTATNEADTESPFETEDRAVDRALTAFGRGKPIMIHDGSEREGETDLIYPAHSVDVPAVSRLRNDAGGLICVALGDSVAEAFDLPFLQEVIDHPLTDNHELTYDTRSSFSLTVNHRKTHTGITDRERSMTIRAVATAASEPERVDFATTFRAPGHVHLLRAAPGLLDDRQGHTEYAIAVAQETGLPAAVTVCEMLDDESGLALSVAAAKAYSTQNDIPFVEGRWLRRRLD